MGQFDEEAPLIPKAATPAWTLWLPGMGIALWIALGVAAAVSFEGWTITTAIYVIVQIVTTIGYGDVTVKSDPGKIFCAFYVFFSIVFLASLITDRIAKVIADDVAYIERKIQTAEVKMNQRGQLDEKGNQPKTHVIASFVLFAVFVVFGTCFFAVYESCSCSFGSTLIKDCVEGPTCSSTGGLTKDWVESFYLSVVTLTTVGFGDFSPKSWIGQIIGIPWMILGVGATALFCSTFAVYLQQHKKESHSLGRMSKDIFDSIDSDKGGNLSKLEFRVYALMKFGKVSQGELATIDQLFRTIDADNSGNVSFEELSRHFDHTH